MKKTRKVNTRIDAVLDAEIQRLTKAKTLGKNRSQTVEALLKHGIKRVQENVLMAEGAGHD